MLKDILWGTPEEIQADQRYAELRKRNRLSVAQQAEFTEVRHLSRRLFLRRGTTVVGGAAVLASPVAAYLISHPEVIQSDEDRFFTEIFQLPPGEQVKRVDNYYSQNRLSIETARARVLPIWVKNYKENSQSDLSEADLLANIILFTNENRNEEQAQIELGRVRIHPARHLKTAAQINFSTFVSNQQTKHQTEGSTAPGIVFLRSEINHELSHFDVTFRDDSSLGKVVNDNSILREPLIDQDSIVINGFNFSTVAPDKSYRVYFNSFDEISTDVIMSYILDKGKDKVVFGYNKAALFRKFLDWIAFPGDDFIRYHRTSNIRALATHLGNFSSKASKQPLSSDIDSLIRGLRIINIFNSGQAEELEVYFPGFMANIFDKPPALIR